MNNMTRKQLQFRIRKTIKILTAALLLLIACICPAAAAEQSAVTQAEQSAQQEITSGMSGNAKSILGDITLENCTNLAEVFAKFWEKGSQQSVSFIRTAIFTVCKTAIVMLLCGGISGISGPTKLPPMVLHMAGALGITAIISGDLTNMMTLCQSTVEELSVFSTVLLPVVMTSVSLSGTPTAGLLMQSGTVLALNLCIALIANVLLPMMSAYIAMITVNSALGNGMLSRLADFVRWIASSILKIIVTVFIGYISVAGSVGKSIDASTIRAAKFALSGAVPVVGGILSNAAETVLAGASLLKNSVGLFGMACVVAICLIPFLRIGICYLIFKAGTAVLSPVCPAALLGLMDGIVNSFRMILGMLGSCCAIVFFELVFTVVFLVGA